MKEETSVTTPAADAASVATKPPAKSTVVARTIEVPSAALTAVSDRLQRATAAYEAELIACATDVLPAIQKACFSKDSPVRELSFFLGNMPGQAHANPAVGVQSFVVSVAQGASVTRGYRVDDIPINAAWGPMVHKAKEVLDRTVVALRRTVGVGNQVIVRATSIDIAP